MDILNNHEAPKQGIYDSYNNFIFSEDRRVFFKMAQRIAFFYQTSQLPGDIVECGVFKGSGLFCWLKMLAMCCPNEIKKVVGFDFFGPEFVETLDTDDREAMGQVFARCDLAEDDTSLEGIQAKILAAGFKPQNFELVKGNISITSEQFAKDRPGFRISLLYLDLDLDEPTYDTLVNLWDRVVPGGIVVFDEYAYHAWSESNGVDRFLREKKLKLCKTGVPAPTAYIVKENY
jgi:hypothetical protein